VTVGMEGNQLEAFASLKPSTVLKASRRDIGLAVAKGLNAATTVAGTMYATALTRQRAC
jgi:pseudouridine-5'-phosphate glycosidase